jgi:hypothetical protein
MDDYIAEANTGEDFVEEVVSGTGEADTFVDDNGAQYAEGYENVPQTDFQPETSYVDWEDESKKWQSMYDKSQSNLEKLESALGTAVEMQRMNQNATVNQQRNEAPQVSEEEFNPWDAYYKPDSPSFKMRETRERTAVDSAIRGHLQEMNQSIALNNTVNELKNVHKMEEDEVRGFLEFVTQPKEEVGLNNLVKLYRDVNNSNNERNALDSLEAVRVSKKTPLSPGALQGKDPRTRPKNEEDSAWDGIMGANVHGRLP